MAVLLPHIEDSSLTHYIPPKGAFERFRDEEHYEEMVRLWEISTTKTVKKEFWYKERTYQRLVKVIGYETYGITDEFHTLIIEFQDGNLTCIHPAFLKEMQSANFGKESVEEDETSSAEKISKPVVAKEKAETKPKAEKKTPVAKPKKTEVPKIELPLDKVHFTAKVKQFAYMWNPFNESNDEAVVLEEVAIEEETILPIGLAWCSHSKTLKKLELQVGDRLDFEGKIVKKTLAKGKDVEDAAFIIDEKVLYKINNPSRIMKKGF